MIQCRACECRQEPREKCKRCGKELYRVTEKTTIEEATRRRDERREMFERGMIVEVVQPKTGRTNQRDTGICPECGGIRPDHTLEEWRNCDGKPKPSVCPEPIIPLRFVQRLAIAEAVQRTGNPKKAAKALGIGSTTIYRLLRVYGITTPYRIGNESKKKSRSGQQK